MSDDGFDIRAPGLPYHVMAGGERKLTSFLDELNDAFTKADGGQISGAGDSNLEEKLSARKRSVKFVVRSDPEPDYLLSFP
jgi:hypothetical protein